MRIEKLNGIADHQWESLLIVNVGGVGYGVDIIRTHHLTHVANGEPVEVWVETILREDGVKLFGFATLEEKFCFNDLRSVSGVGPKIAAAILESYAVTLIREAVLERNQKLFESVSGIGKRLAERIVVELKPRFEKNASVPASTKKDQTLHASRSGAASGRSAWTSDLRQALEQLDFNDRDIQKVLQELRQDDEGKSMDISSLVKRALLILRQHG